MQIEVKRLLPLLIGFVLVAVVLGLMIYLAGNAPAPELFPVSEQPTEEQRQAVLSSLRAPEGTPKPSAADTPDLRSQSSGTRTAEQREQLVKSLQSLRAQ